METKKIKSGCYDPWGKETIQEWYKTENYCPNCGKQSIWTYIVGPSMCTECKKLFESDFEAFDCHEGDLYKLRQLKAN